MPSASVTTLVASLPNERAIEPQISAIYRRFGLNDRQIEILARATPRQRRLLGDHTPSNYD